MVRDIQAIDDDICAMKRLIRQKLTSDPDIIEVLNNQKLDPSSPDDYLNKNIFTEFTGKAIIKKKQKGYPYG